MLLLLLACVPKPTIVEAATPTLPAVDAPLYTVAPGYTPTDPVVAAMTGEEPLDESLCGAAAAAALVRADGGRIDKAAITWAAYRAGWPHPVAAWQTVTLDRDAVPELTFLAELRAAAGPDAILGMSRARGPGGDTWVAMASTPTVTLGAFPKELTLQTNFEFPVLDVGEWVGLRQVGVGPDLRVQKDDITLNVLGEWVVELWGMDESEREEVVARVPLYVGRTAPQDGPFLNSVPTQVEDLNEAVLDALDVLRGLENAPTLKGNASLSVAAREGLTRMLETGQPDPEALDRLARLGYPEASELACRGETVTDCLEDLWWSIEDRVRLLQPEYKQVGVAASVGDGLTVVVTLAAE